MLAVVIPVPTFKYVRSSRTYTSTHSLAHLGRTLFHNPRVFWYMTANLHVSSILPCFFSFLVSFDGLFSLFASQVTTRTCELQSKQRLSHSLSCEHVYFTLFFSTHSSILISHSFIQHWIYCFSSSYSGWQWRRNRTIATCQKGWRCVRTWCSLIHLSSTSCKNHHAKTHNRIHTCFWVYCCETQRGWTNPHLFCIIRRRRYRRQNNTAEASSGTRMGRNRWQGYSSTTHLLGGKCFILIQIITWIDHISPLCLPLGGIDFAWTHIR